MEFDAASSFSRCQAGAHGSPCNQKETVDPTGVLEWGLQVAARRIMLRRSWPCFLRLHRGAVCSTIQLLFLPS